MRKSTFLQLKVLSEIVFSSRKTLHTRRSAQTPDGIDSSIATELSERRSQARRTKNDTTKGKPRKPAHQRSAAWCSCRARVLTGSAATGCVPANRAFRGQRQWTGARLAPTVASAPFLRRRRAKPTCGNRRTHPNRASRCDKLLSQCTLFARSSRFCFSSFFRSAPGVPPRPWLAYFQPR